MTTDYLLCRGISGVFDGQPAQCARPCDCRCHIQPMPPAHALGVSACAGAVHTQTHVLAACHVLPRRPHTHSHTHGRRTRHWPPQRQGKLCVSSFGVTPADMSGHFGGLPASLDIVKAPETGGRSHTRRVRCRFTCTTNGC